MGIDTTNLHHIFKILVKLINVAGMSYEVTSLITWESNGDLGLKCPSATSGILKVSRTL